MILSAHPAKKQQVVTLNTRAQKKRVLSHTENIHGHDIKFYKQSIDGNEYTVPTHVNRVDCEKAKGWQIRRIRKYQPKLDKFIPDRKFHDEQSSLNMAVEVLRIHLKSIQPMDVIPFAVNDAKKGVNKTGYPGVRLDWDKRKGKKYYELSIEVTIGKYDPTTYKAFYVGTENTITQERLESALNEAIEWREHLVRKIIIEKNVSIPSSIDLSRATNHKVTVEQAHRLLKKLKVKEKQKLKQQKDSAKQSQEDDSDSIVA